ncbi:MAG: response regulator transcription factor [Sinobacteraceae bacterium]|nr:response regulator transcription factor [Nevskiaceae bacterium]
MTLKVLLIEDQPRPPPETSRASETTAELKVMAAHDAGEGLAAAAGDPELDLVLLDLELTDPSGLSLVESLHAQRPELPVVVLASHEEPDHLRQAIDAGAAGFMPKSAATRVLIKALQLVGEEQTAETPTAEATPLTQRQIEVLGRICEGKTNKQIALELGLSEKTIKAHVTAIFKALGVVNRTQAVLVAQRAGVRIGPQPV